MNCHDWEERIALHAGGDLDSSEGAEVERHLADCPGCQVFWSGLRQTLGDLHEMQVVELSPADLTRVRTGVMAEIERSRKVWRRLAWVSGVGIAAVLLLGAAMVKTSSPLPPALPPVTSRIPEAPLVRSTQVVAGRQPAARHPLLVKLQTADPNIVIYWIGEY